MLLLRSAMKKVGCLPVVAASWLLTRGCAGSLRIGLVPPGTIEKSTLKVNHPALPDEKSGGDAFSCATAPAVSAAQVKPVRTPAASNFAVEANVGIVFLSCAWVAFYARNRFTWASVLYGIAVAAAESFFDQFYGVSPRSSRRMREVCALWVRHVRCLR